MNKKIKDTFVVIKKDGACIAAYPYKQNAWKMDRFTLGAKLSRKFPTHAQTIKVLALSGLPFFYDGINNQIKCVSKDVSELDTLLDVYNKYMTFTMGKKDADISHVLPIKFCNDSKKDFELLHSFLDLPV